MRKIAIVGAGQAGCIIAHALHQKGYEVTLYSDKTPEDFLTNQRPTGVAARFDMALSWERELGLEHWGKVAPEGNGVHLTFSLEKGNQLLTLLGRIQQPFLAIDVRLQSATWMTELAQQGGRVEIENVTVERLEEIAAANDLTMVAAGRRELRALFPRDETRSTYSTPQRHLTMVNVTGVPTEIPYCDWFRPVKFNFFATYGEAFAVPWLSKNLQKGWGVLFEAKEGTPMDRFRDVKTGEEALARAKEVLKDIMPWDYEWLRDGELCDEHSWLTGAFVPEVRQVAGALPSGRRVLALGDTAQTVDPIGGQGANNGNKQARNLFDAILERGEQPFDAPWMEATFDRYWERHHYVDDFNNMLLEPLTPAGQLLLTAQYGSTAKPGENGPRQQLADAFLSNFNDAKELTEAFADEARARAVIQELFGSTRWPLLRGKAGIARGQIRQKLGRHPRHPGTIGAPMR